MKALISPLENNRICEVAENDFPVADPLFWVDCPDNCTTEWVFDGTSVINQLIKETPEQTIARLEAALDRHLDSVANSYRYDSIRTMVTYDGDPYPKFDAEGKAAKAWRSACYALTVEIMNNVLAGNRGVPTESELIAEMPLITDYLTY